MLAKNGVFIYKPAGINVSDPSSAHVNFGTFKCVGQFSLPGINEDKPPLRMNTAYLKMKQRYGEWL